MDIRIIERRKFYWCTNYPFFQNEFHPNCKIKLNIASFNAYILICWSIVRWLINCCKNLICTHTIELYIFKIIKKCLLDWVTKESSSPCPGPRIASLIWLFTPFGSKSVAQLKYINARWVFPNFLWICKKGIVLRCYHKNHCYKFISYFSYRIID